MPDPNLSHAAGRDGVAVSPALDLVLESQQVPKPSSLVDRRVLRIAALAVGLGYDFRVSRNVSITPSLDLQGQRYDTHDERLVSFGIGVTFH